MVQNQNNKQVIVNDLKSNSSCVHVLCDDAICFRQPKYHHSSLGLYNFFVECNQSKNQLKENSNMWKTTKEAPKENKNDERMETKWTAHSLAMKLCILAPAVGQPNFSKILPR